MKNTNLKKSKQNRTKPFPDTLIGRRVYKAVNGPSMANQGNIEGSKPLYIPSNTVQNQNYLNTR